MVDAVTTKRRTATKAVAPLEPVVLPDGQEAPIPNSSGYVITKPINLGQLMAEIKTATGTEVVNSCVLGPDDHTQAIGPDNPAQLWLAPTSFDATALAQVVADHVPDPNWAIPSYIQNFHGVLAKLQDDPTAALSDADKDALLRGMALQYAVLLDLRGQM